MLIALITMMLLSGGSIGLLDIGAVKKEVKSVMADTEQRKAALKTLKATEKRVKAQNKFTKNTSKRLGKALSDHEVALADVDAIWSEYHNASMQSHRDMVDLRFELKQHISREEWMAIFSQ
jgi:tRNA U34 5-carboxymethylaminomethyl modifying enzyme MnmG/GidA